MEYDTPNWWRVPDMWRGAEVFLIGGGASLVGFDFAPLRGRHVIGCNDAFIKLGAEVVPVSVFGDGAWYFAHKADCIAYPGLLITCAPECYGYPNLHATSRKMNEVTSMGSDALGWHFNTGALAIQLAASMGASRIVLLGYDMKCAANKRHNNWYREKDDNTDAHYQRFLRCFADFQGQFKTVFPDVEVLNAGPDSVLTGYKMVELGMVLK